MYVERQEAEVAKLERVRIPHRSPSRSKQPRISPREERLEINRQEGMNLKSVTGIVQVVASEL